MGPDPDGSGFAGHHPHIGGPGFRGGPPFELFGPMLAGLMTVAVLLALLWLARHAWTDRTALPDGARSRWDRAVHRHGTVASAFARYECDPVAVLANPALADVRRPATARFVDAFAEAGALLTDRYPGAETAAAFGTAVEREERAWAAAVASAERSGDAHFTAEERDVLEQARHLLDLAMSSPFEEERHTALRTALRRLADLERRTGWRFPVPAARAVEHRARGALLAG
jgi:hypothetical protein